jgi:hypothetical protein
VVVWVAAMAVTVGLFGLAAVWIVTAYAWGSGVAGAIVGALIAVTLAAVYLGRRTPSR